MASTILPRSATLADLLTRLGHVPPDRIRLHPAPGTATETDLLVRPGGEKRLCELVDGVLVDKPMGMHAIPLKHQRAALRHRVMAKVKPAPPCAPR